MLFFILLGRHRESSSIAKCHTNRIEKKWINGEKQRKTKPNSLNSERKEVKKKGKEMWYDYWSNSIEREYKYVITGHREFYAYHYFFCHTCNRVCYTMSLYII